MDERDVHAAAKSAFLATCRWRNTKLSPLRAQLSQFLLREVDSWSTWVSMSPSQRVRNWQDGFLSQSAALYDFETYDRNAFLTDMQREKTAYINEPQFVDVLANKVGFYLAMAGFEAHRPETFGVIDDGTFHPISTFRPVMTDGASEETSLETDTASTRSALSIVRQKAPSQANWGSERSDPDPGQWVLDRLRAGEQIVCKPVDAAGGDGVTHYSYEEGTYHVDGRETSATAIREEIASLDANVVMEFVEQASYADELFPDATNTIRMVTMFDNDSGEAFCPVAVHRIGTEHSAPVDNFDRHGISAEINLETGELGTGVQLSAAGEVERHETHPTTGARIAGTDVPGWETIRDSVLEIAEAVSYVPYVGWDVVVTAPGEFVLLEANNCPGVKSLQAHGPLLADRRTRQFYADHGVCASDRVSG